MNFVSYVTETETIVTITSKTFLTNHTFEVKYYNSRNNLRSKEEHNNGSLYDYCFLFYRQVSNSDYPFEDVFT